MNAIMTSHIFMHFLLALAALVLLPLHALQAKDETTSKPNVILIIADDVSWNDLGCTGSPTARTPHLDRLAAHGRRFDAAFLFPTFMWTAIARPPARR